jgi:hypothetical protein
VCTPTHQRRYFGPCQATNQYVLDQKVVTLDRLSRRLIRSIYEEGGSVGEAVGGHSFGQCELLWDVSGSALARSKRSHGRDRRSFKDLSWPVFALFEPALDLPSF